MLVPCQMSGAKTPLYFIHGLTGVMPIGPFLAQSLGPDQPLYIINANGIDGRETVTGSLKDMALTYVEEILCAQPSGPLLIAGMCDGGLIAIEVVREFQARGREVGPVILVDPPPSPAGLIKHNQTVDPQDSLVAAQLYERVRGQLLRSASRPHNDMPFAANNQQQVHLATMAAVNTLVAFAKHVPEIFPGAVAAILSLQRAAGFFHPQMHWVKLLAGRPRVHVLPYGHNELFHSGRHDLARVLKFVLEDAMNSGIPAERAAEPAFAPA